MARPAKILTNTLIEEIRWEWEHREEKHIWPLWLDDIVSGVCRLDWYGDRANQTPLSTTKLILILTELEEISTVSVMELLKTSRRMASSYASAARLAYPFIEKSLGNDSIKNIAYPKAKYVSEKHARFEIGLPW